MIRITEIIDKILEFNPEAELDLVERAYIYSARVHDGQVRLSGEPYLSHPLEVAGILADMKLDPVSVAAALLHDVIEDTHASREEIEAMFGKNVAHIEDRNFKRHFSAGLSGSQSLKTPLGHPRTPRRRPLPARGDSGIPSPQRQPANAARSKAWHGLARSGQADQDGLG